MTEEEEKESQEGFFSRRITLTIGPEVIEMVSEQPDGSKEEILRIGPSPEEMTQAGEPAKRPLEEFFLTGGQETSAGIQTGKSFFILIAGNWAEAMHEVHTVVSAYFAKTTQGEATSKKRADLLAQAIERVAGSILDSRSILNDHKIFARALLQTPELQYLLGNEEEEKEESSCPDGSGYSPRPS